VDLRDESTTPLNFTKSINLALSERGINAMRHAGSSSLLESVLSQTIPMYGRMIHGEDFNGALTEEAQLYDVHGRYQRAVDRGALNKTLLDQLSEMENVNFFFHHKLTGADFGKRKAWFEVRSPSQSQSTQRAQETEVDFDIILGCDGAHSSVRYHMMKYVRMDYKQSYIDTLWCEFTIPPARTDPSTLSPPSTTPSAKDGFATSPNHLHIWPGSDKMFIAIPNPDKTFTCTLFAPASDFAALEKDVGEIEPFFQRQFPGVADLVGPAELKQLFKQNPHLPLISIKCSPYHYASAGVILGDAAHAMVPFYGQGMNAGLEDVRVLFSYFDANPSTSIGRAAALKVYSEERVKDAHMINDLALANYWEMHAGVRSTTYLIRKKIEEFLSDKVPSSGFATQYSRVSFSNQRYSDVAKVVARQKKILLTGMWSSALVPVMAVAVVWMWKWRRGERITLLKFSSFREWVETVTQGLGRIVKR
jgi:kynurenine 3-monooxygenase